MTKILVCAIFLMVLSGINCKKKNNTPDQLPDSSLDITVLTQNLTFPWDLVWGADNQLWMTERLGKVSRVDPATGNVTLIATINDVKSVYEGGLLGLVLHPNFNTDPQVFVAYNYDNSGTYSEKIVRYTFNGTTLINPVVLLDNISASSIHNGCRLLISPDLKLFITTGDASNQANPQNRSSLNGKVLRINLDGTIPTDNPLPGNPVWSFGHRNAQGLVFVNQNLYSSEHGPDMDDEINIIQKGRNYGWPEVRGFCNETAEQSFCNANQVAEPLFKWTPTIAPSGIDFYNHDLIPQWKNSVLMCTLKDQTLYQLKLNAAVDQISEVKEVFRGTYGRLRDVCISPEGKVYICTSNGSNDKIIVISKK